MAEVSRKIRKRDPLPVSLPLPVRFQPKMANGDNLAGDVQKVRTSSKALGLYVHVPFCVTRCYFCDFVTVVGKNVTPENVEQYVRALHAEIRMYEASEPFASASYLTAQLGGGTPTMLSPGQLNELLGAMRRVAGDTEIVVEGFPTSVTPEKLDVLGLNGAIKFNMGVQTFNDRVLEAIGRRHERDDALRAIAAAKESGLPSVGIDLIYGLPGGGTDVVAADISTALEFEVDHIALYPLWVYPQTRLNSLMATGRRDKGEFKERHEQLLAADDLLRSDGFQRYTAFHYSRGTEHHHQYGLWQMRASDWLGIGQGAVSQLDGVVYENDRNFRGYLARVDAGMETAVTADRMDERAQMVRHFSYGIREASYSLSAFAERFGVSASEIFADEIDRMVAEGLVDATEDHLSLTLLGVLRLGDVEAMLAPEEPSIARMGACCE